MVQALMVFNRMLQAITGISMPMGSDRLYSGSADGSVRVWDGKSGKVAGLSALGIPLRLFMLGSPLGSCLR